MPSARSLRPSHDDVINVTYRSSVRHCALARDAVGKHNKTEPSQRLSSTEENRLAKLGDTVVIDNKDTIISLTR